MIKLLMGGSPCTHWSIAQSKHRETEPCGIGWDLFENYLIALKKFRPDYFLYENNKSMSRAIRQEITNRFGFEPVCINSALVSAQNRQRLYWCGKRNLDRTYSKVDIRQPEDKGILLRDILEIGEPWRENSGFINANYDKGCSEKTCGHQSGARFMVAEPLITTPDGKSFCITANEYKGSNPQQTIKKHRRTMVAEPIRVGAKPNLKGETVNCQRESYEKAELCITPWQEANYDIIDGAKVFVANKKIRRGDSRGSKQGKYIYLPTCDKTNTIGSGQAHNEKVL